MSSAIDLSNLSKEEIEKYLAFPEKDTKQLLGSLIKIMSEEWENLMVTGRASEEEMIVPLVIREAARIDVLKYLMIDAPLETTSRIIRSGIKIARLVYGMNVSTFLEEIEKITVKMAVEYGMKFFLQNEIRITPGALKVEYVSKKGNFQQAIFQYLIVFQPLTEQQGEIGIEIYSTQSLEPPKSRGSFSGIFGTPNMLEQNLQPFIVQVQGKVEKGQLDYFSWKGYPAIEISFPDNVPDLGFRPLSFWQRHLWKPLEEKVKETIIVLEKALGTSTKLLGGARNLASKTAERLKEAVANLLEKIKSSFISTKPEAQVVGKVGQELTEKLLQEQATSEVSEPSPGTEPILAKGQVGLEDLTDQFDDLSEEAELFLVETEALLAQQEREQAPSKIDLAGTQDSGLEQTDVQDKPQPPPPTPQTIATSTICALDSPQLPLRNTVIFNEIAWMGGVNSAEDEWLELSNISANQVDLKGWQLLDKAAMENKSGAIKIVFGNATLTPGGFFLLERTNDNSVPGIKADLIYAGPLANTDEALYLFDKDCKLQDKVEANPSWQAGDNTTKKTMERRFELGWQTSRDVGGTPKASNSPGESAQYYAVGGGTPTPPPSQPAPCSLPPTTSSPALWPVVLNEIAWMGTPSSSDDEWLELKNISTSTVALGDWQILDKNLDIKIILESGATIAAGDFYLLERTNDNTLPNIAADKIYTGALNNTEETLYLFNANCALIDKIEATSSWPAGDNTTRKTMERKTNFTWQTSQGIGGTPKAENSLGEEPLPGPEPELPVAQTVVISELQIKDKEFVELHNPSTSTIEMASWYFAYFSANRDWNNPHRNKGFFEGTGTTTIPGKGYYLIGLNDYPQEDGNPNSDWQAYSTKQLGDTAGAVGIFTCDPSATTTEAAQNCKIDLVAWGETEVKESTSTLAPPENKTLTRRKNQTGNYIDSNNNSQDFEIKNPSPTNSKGETNNLLPPEPVLNFLASSVNNAVTLTWASSTDPDSPAENISYFISYAKEGGNEATTTATSTTLALADLYYNSIYHFGIRAFDGLWYSETATGTLTILPETSQWQMVNHDAYRTGLSPYPGPSTSTIKWAFDVPRQTQTSPVVDQNGTIYLGVTDGLLALKEEGGQPQTKWFFEAEGTFFGHPLIGPDGTVFITKGGKLLAIAPNGALKWETEINSSGEPSFILANEKLFLSASYIIKGKRRPLLVALEASNGALSWVFDLAEEQTYPNFGEIAGQNDIMSPPSLPTLSKDGNVYVGFGPTLFALDLQGNSQWKKIFPIKDGWQNQVQPTFGAISVANEGTVYFVIKNKEYELFIGGSTTTEYANFLYGLKPGSNEIEWDPVKIFSAGGPILIGKERTLFVITDINNTSELYKIAPDGTLTQTQLTSELYSFLPRFIDDENKIYGRGGGLLEGLTILDSAGNKIVFYHQDKFALPFALSEDGVLYAPSYKSLYAFSAD